MVNLRLFTLPLAIACALLVTGETMAQRFQPFGPVDFTHDLQPFAPADISSFGGGPDPNVGYFFTYDYVNMWVNRPSNARLSQEFDQSGGGSRLSFGYMSEANHGWLAELMDVDGPNVPINLGPQAAPVIVPENFASITSFEFSKLWRFKPLHHGSHVELFLGGRYATINTQDGFDYFPNDPNFTGIFGVSTENNILGPQVGLRWFKQKGRFIISAEGRYFYAYNKQFINGRIFDPDPAQQDTLIVEQLDHWVAAGDIRVQATCEVTKAFSLSAGWEMLYFGNGVARGLGDFSDQDIMFTGWTVGFNVNR